jgi:mono/diheme cytochrome c family protein
MRRWFALGAGIVVVLLLAIQLVPYGRDHTNPQASGVVPWPDAQTEQLFSAACADCHSYDTEWPWYASVAPMSWLVQFDVDEGREAFNVSTWPNVREADEAAETVMEGEMPPLTYPITHPDARLSDDEKSALAAGLTSLFGAEGGDD